MKNLILTLVLAFSLGLNAQQKERNIILEPTITVGSYEDIIASLVVTESSPNAERIFVKLPEEWASTTHYVYLTRQKEYADIFGSTWISNDIGYYLTMKLKKNTTYYLWFWRYDIYVEFSI